MMRKWCVVALLAISSMLFATLGEAAGPLADAAVAKRIQAAIPSLPITAVRQAPIAGLYELQVGRNIFYSDADGSHLISGGQIFDTATKHNLTRDRLEEINRMDWSTLPLDKAVVSGDPKGKLKLAIFTDPECPYCRKFEHELASVKGVKVYSFLFPLSFHKHAKRWATAIWCSKDQHKTMTDIMLHDANPAAGKCATPLDDIAKLAKQLHITGTPTLISGDGRIASGGKSAADLMRWLERR